MRISLKGLFIISFSILICKTAEASMGVAAGYGFQKGLSAYRISIQESSCFYYDPLSAYWEGSLSFVKSRHKTSPNFHTHSQLWGASLAQVYRLEERNSDKYLLPYLESGLGLALFNKRYTGPKKLGLNALFEIKFGGGIHFGPHLEYDISYKWIHYSNAYLARHNDALNFSFIIFNYWF